MIRHVDLKALAAHGVNTLLTLMVWPLLKGSDDMPFDYLVHMNDGKLPDMGMTGFKAIGLKGYIRFRQMRAALRRALRSWRADQGRRLSAAIVDSSTDHQEETHMASIVGGFCVPHDPAITAFPEVANKRQAKNIMAGFERVAKRVAELQADTAIVIGDDHFALFGPHCLPSFLIGIGDVEGPEENWMHIDRYPVPNNVPLAEHIMNYGFDHGFDWSVAKSLVLDHGTMIPVHLAVTPQPGRADHTYLYGGSRDAPAAHEARAGAGPDDRRGGGGLPRQRPGGRDGLRRHQPPRGHVRHGAGESGLRPDDPGHGGARRRRGDGRAWTMPTCCARAATAPSRSATGSSPWPPCRAFAAR